MVMAEIKKQVAETKKTVKKLNLLSENRII